MRRLRLIRKYPPKEDAADVGGGGNLFHMRFEHRELPDAGAMQYANESLALPPYMPWNGITVYRSFHSQQPPMFAHQGVVKTAVIPAGIMSGQYVTQPLLDPALSANLGVSPLALANNSMPTLGAF